MELATTLDFAHAARALTGAARRAGLDAPGFRCPPRVVGADRTIRRRRDGAVVSVRVRGRASVAVIADMIEGIVVANRLTTPEADRARSLLWHEAMTLVDASMAGPPDHPALPGSDSAAA